VEQRTGQSIHDIARSKQAVIVTRGAEGSTLLCDGEQVHIAAAKAGTVVDPTGCGDAYRAGLLYGMTQNWSWADSCRLASVMGAIKIEHRGPQNHAPDREEIAARLYASYGLSL